MAVGGRLAYRTLGRVLQRHQRRSGLPIAGEGLSLQSRGSHPSGRIAFLALRSPSTALAAPQSRQLVLLCTRQYTTSTRLFAEPRAGEGSPAAAPAGGGTPAAPKPLAGNWIVDVDMSNFAQLVLDCPVPVILDCHAEWCDPCKKLGPMLESLVKKSGGWVRLAKLDVDQNQDLAMRLQVQSLPTVFGLYQGRMVDTFKGLQTEAVLKTFVENLTRLVGYTDAESPVGKIKKAHQLASEQKFEEAAAIYKEVIATAEEKSPVDKDLAAQALAGLARVAAAAGQDEAAREICRDIRKKYSPEMKFYPEVAQTVTAIELEAQGAGLDSEKVKELQQKVQANPADHDSRHQLALALFHEHRYEEAIDQGIELLKRDRSWNENAAQKLLLQIFEALGPAHELVRRGRSRMTNYLFT